MARICIDIVPVFEKSGEGRYRGRNAGLYTFSRHVLLIIKLKYMLTTGDITTLTDLRKEERFTYWHIFLKADSGWPGDCNRFSNSGGCWGGYHRANLTSKGSFCWNLGLSLGLSQCNTSRGCDRALHFHRRISRLLSIFNILGEGRE